MNDPFDRLERDLRRAVRARRRRLGVPALAVLGALVLGGGGAVAATQLAGGSGIEREVNPPVNATPAPTGLDRNAWKVFLQVVKATGRKPACRLGAKDPAIADFPLDGQLSALLPALEQPVDGVDPARVLDGARRGLGGTVQRRSIRTLRLAGGVELDVFVVGGPRAPERDPQACAELRLQHARRLASGTVLAQVERQIAASLEPRLDEQMLYVFTREPGSGGGGGVGTRADRPPLKPGIVGSGSGKHGTRRYTGIARPGVAAIRVVPERGATKTAHVVQGFYSFALPRHIGPVQLHELDASGAIIRSFRLRA